ncbi:MAG: DUF4111 domain-containing protein [Blastochloris sp.]|nr:DUF4111 domain-containing protein [Blastochloris sp.]
MSFSSWETCPTTVRTQVEQFLAATQATLSNNLVGVYLHGSLAMDCFNPAHSDLDLLVITHHPMSVLVKRQVAEQLLHLSRCPTQIEISYLTQAMLLPWQYPPRFDLHYSEMWRADYERDLMSEAWQQWNATQRHDPDLAAHITVLRQRGVTLFGAPILTVFPAIPPSDYLVSIIGDVTDALGAIMEEPIYAILNACRTLAYLDTGRIYSKDEGGQWALDNLPLSLRGLVQQAQTYYADETQTGQFALSTLVQFQEHMRQELQRLVS